jgi:ABC-type uncharacterized transport system substrate-binding protein
MSRSMCIGGGADIDYIRRTAAELARSKSDVIVPYATRVLFAVRDATRDIPVVFLATSMAGLLKSFHNWRHSSACPKLVDADIRLLR